ncbi:MAG: hypothetical protein ABI866_00570 [Dokdonella sp.]
MAVDIDLDSIEANPATEAVFVVHAQSHDEKGILFKIRYLFAYLRFSQQLSKHFRLKAHESPSAWTEQLGDTLDVARHHGMVPHKPVDAEFVVMSRDDKRRIALVRSVAVATH